MEFGFSVAEHTVHDLLLGLNTENGATIELDSDLLSHILVVLGSAHCVLCTLGIHRVS